MTDVIDDIVEEALRELADEGAQRELWLAAGGAEVSSLTECVSRLWDDSALSIAFESGDAVYTSEIDSRFRTLQTKLARIDDMRSPLEIFDDPMLPEVRALAADILGSLDRYGFEQS